MTLAWVFRQFDMIEYSLFVALLIGLQIAGLWGALFGVPIAAVIAIFVRHWVDLYNPPEAVAAEAAAQSPAAPA